MRNPLPWSCICHLPAAPGLVGVTSAHVVGAWYIDMSCILHTHIAACVKLDQPRRLTKSALTRIHSASVRVSLLTQLQDWSRLLVLHEACAVCVFRAQRSTGGFRLRTRIRLQTCVIAQPVLHACLGLRDAEAISCGCSMTELDNLWLCCARVAPAASRWR